MMAEPDPARTLALASQFRAPKPDNKALQDLQTRHLLTKMQQTGATERSTASDLSRLTGTLAPHGLSPTSIQQPGILSTILGQKGAESAAKAASGLTDAGIRDIGPGTYKPGEFYKRDVTPGQPLKGEAMEFAKAKVLAERERIKKLKRIRRLTPEEGGGFGEETITERDKQAGTTQGGRQTQQRAEELQGLVAAKFGKNAKIVGETDTHFSISIDGAKPVPVRKNMVKRK
jgi:hypothetical protein